MSTAPTISGLPISVAPLPAGAFVSHYDIARAAGFTDSAALAAAISHNEAPKLPMGQRMGGQIMVATHLASMWLRDLAQHRENEPERKAREQAQAKERYEQSMRDRQAARDAEAQHLREQRAHFRAMEQVHIEQAAAEEAKQANRQVIILDANGRRVS
jgi:uncharacterized transporter YbjL